MEFKKQKITGSKNSRQFPFLNDKAPSRSRCRDTTSNHRRPGRNSYSCTQPLDSSNRSRRHYWPHDCAAWTVTPLYNMSRKIILLSIFFQSSWNINIGGEKGEKCTLYCRDGEEFRRQHRDCKQLKAARTELKDWNRRGGSPASDWT